LLIEKKRKNHLKNGKRRERKEDKKKDREKRKHIQIHIEMKLSEVVSCPFLPIALILYQKATKPRQNKVQCYHQTLQASKNT